MFRVTELSAGYSGAPVIQGLSFALERGSSLIFVGKNGCGKTTLMRALIGFLPYSGRIELDDVDARQMPRGLYARRVAMLSQLSSLYLPYTVFETTLMGRYAYKKGFIAGFSKEDQEIAGSCLAEVGLYEQRAHLASQLSGGQLQRLFLARALCQTPEILLLDEPTNHLDLKQQLSLIDLLARWRDKGGIICGAMHDLNLTLHFGGQVLLLDAGRIKLHGEAAQVMRSREINECFGVDVVDFMRKSLSSWQ